MKPGKLDEFIGLFKEHIMPTCGSFGIRVHAGWRNDAQNEFVWVRSYDDEETLERYSSSPERAAYTGLTQACIEHQEIRMVEPVVGVVPVANA